jgi:hypothetical protein
MNFIQNQTKKIIFAKSSYFRKQRFNFFYNLIIDLPKPISIADIGGTIDFWKKTPIYKNKNYHITIINLTKDKKNKYIKQIKSDGRYLENIKNKKYDICFSNSTIEHLSAWQDQQKMANQIKRIAKYYFIQTPNYYFPIEPHYHLPLFQFLPKKIKILLIENLKLSGRGSAKNKKQIIKNIDSISLLKYQQLIKLFPESAVKKERFCGLTKSFMVYSKKIKK